MGRVNQQAKEESTALGKKCSHGVKKKKKVKHALEGVGGMDVHLREQS